MKLYIIYQILNKAHGACTSALVAADTADKAMQMHPETGEHITDWDQKINDVWVNSIDHVHARYIGEAGPWFKEGVVINSHITN